MIDLLILGSGLFLVAYIAIRYLAGQMGIEVEDRPTQRSAAQTRIGRGNENRLSDATSFEYSEEPPEEPISEDFDSSGQSQRFEKEPGINDWQPTPLRRRKTSFGSFFSLLMLGLLSFGWLKFGSFDQAFFYFFPKTETPRANTATTHGPDWAIVDEIRWFHIIGTDSAGVGYNGWISELAFRTAPPEPTPGGKNLLQKLGIPSVAESAKAAKQLQKLGAELKKANSQR